MNNPLVPSPGTLLGLPGRALPGTIVARTGRSIDRLLAEEVVTDVRLERAVRVTARGLLGAAQISRTAGALAAADPMAEADLALVKTIGIHRIAAIVAEGI